MKTEIKIEIRNHNGKDVECYIPYIESVNCMGRNCFILKESISNEKVITDNYSIAEMVIKNKVKEITYLIDEYGEILYKYL
jgi:hypothetical protein